MKWRHASFRRSPTWSRLSTQRWPTLPAAAEIGWCASPGAHSAVWGSSPSISSMRPGCNRDCEELSASDPERARSVRERARRSVERLAEDFPGDPVTGLLDPSEEAEARFEDFANDEPCAALDPGTGLCDLYLSRPMTCRVFGPPVRSEQGLGVCELCYHGATEEQIAACEMPVDPEGLEAQLLEEFEQSSGRHGRTLVAFALRPAT